MALKQNPTTSVLVWTAPSAGAITPSLWSVIWICLSSGRFSSAISKPQASVGWAKARSAVPTWTAEQVMVGSLRLAHPTRDDDRLHRSLAECAGELARHETVLHRIEMDVINV